MTNVPGFCFRFQYCAFGHEFGHSGHRCGEEFLLCGDLLLDLN